MRIQLEYDSQSSYALKDARTHTLSIQLFLRNIHNYQLDERTILLENPRDATFACALASAVEGVKRFKIM